MTDSNTEEQPSAPKCVSSYDTSDPLQQDVTRSFKNDILCITFLRNDGVLRSPTADRKVLSAEGPNFKAQMMNLVFADGSKTPKEMWLEQNAGTLPEPLSQQEIDRVKNQPDGRKDLLLTRMHENLLDVNGVLA